LTIARGAKYSIAPNRSACSHSRFAAGKESMRRHLVAIFFVLFSPVAASAFDVTTCDQLVPAHQVGQVLNDLDCSGAFSAVASTTMPRCS
jgi:hypothetical protein